MPLRLQGSGSDGGLRPDDLVPAWGAGVRSRLCSRINGTGRGEVAS